MPRLHYAQQDPRDDFLISISTTSARCEIKSRETDSGIHEVCQYIGCSV
jgi:hypothetical protein